MIYVHICFLILGLLTNSISFAAMGDISDHGRAAKAKPPEEKQNPNGSLEMQLWSFQKTILEEEIASSKETLKEAQRAHAQKEEEFALAQRAFHKEEEDSFGHLTLFAMHAGRVSAAKASVKSHEESISVMKRALESDGFHQTLAVLEEYTGEDYLTVERDRMRNSLAIEVSKQSSPGVKRALSEILDFIENYESDPEIQKEIDKKFKSIRHTVSGRLSFLEYGLVRENKILTDVESKFKEFKKKFSNKDVLKYSERWLKFESEKTALEASRQNTEQSRIDLNKLSKQWHQHEAGKPAR